MTETPMSEALREARARARDLEESLAVAQARLTVALARVTLLERQLVVASRLRGEVVGRR